MPWFELGEVPSDAVDQIALGYRGAQILFTANRLGLFEALGRERAATAQALAEELGANERAVRMLCDALVSLTLLERTGGGYRNGEPALKHLLSDSPQSKVHSLRHSARLYERWGSLLDTVMDGRPADDAATDPRLQRRGREFTRAMADVGRAAARSTAEVLDLQGAATVLDLGGGPGLYSLEFVRRNARLQAVVMDRPKALEIARQMIADSEVADRIVVREGDAFGDDLEGPWDCIFLSNFVHIYPAEKNRELIKRCAAALAPGGRLAIKDFLLDADRLTPAGGAIFAINMLVSTEGGDCYTVDEASTWVEEAGLVSEELLDVATRSRILVARKPDRS